jgi:hypothetical protein
VVRTEIYLSEDQQRRLHERSGASGRSESELIQEAIDSLLAQPDLAERLAMLRSARGMWEHREDLPDLRELRRGWNRFPGDVLDG